MHPRRLRCLKSAHFMVMQRVAVCCGVLWCVVVCCIFCEAVGTRNSLNSLFEKCPCYGDAVCCSVLQCVAVCCSVLQCFSLCTLLIQTTHLRRPRCLKSAHLIMTQRVAVGCNVLQHVAIFCIVYAVDTYNASLMTSLFEKCLFHGDTACCSVLQCATVCYSVLQCAAVCCSVLQCVAVCDNLIFFQKFVYRYMCRHRNDSQNARQLLLQCVAVCCSV